MSEDPKSKPTITARAILNALAESKRRGRWPLFQQLETQEPELTEHVLEELSLIHQTLMESGASPKVTRRLKRQVQSLDGENPMERWRTRPALATMGRGGPFF